MFSFAIFVGWTELNWKMKVKSGLLFVLTCLVVLASLGRGLGGSVGANQVSLTSKQTDSILDLSTKVTPSTD